MKNLKTLNFFFSLLFCVLIKGLSAQCPTTDITLSTQSQVDSFPILYPNCSILMEGLTIDGLAITDLSPLSSIPKKRYRC